MVQRGNGVGDISYYNADFEKATINPTMIIISDFQGLSKYLAYYLLSKKGKGQLLSLVSGSSIPALYQKPLATLSFNLPPLPIQQAIAHILGTLDDKIELNRQMNQTLEAMAQALFKSWFVDFDPVIDNALLAGHALPTALQPKVDKRLMVLKNKNLEPRNIFPSNSFPDEFQETRILGYIPKYWQEVDFEKLTTESKEKVGDREFKEYSSTNDGLFPRELTFNKRLAKSSSKNKVIRFGDIVFGMSRKVLNFGVMETESGSVSSAYKVFNFDIEQLPITFVNDYMRMRPHIYFSMLKPSSREGQSLSVGHFKKTPILVPPKNIVTQFQTIYLGYKERIERNNHQTQTLTHLRDTLLPQLISGKLSVPEAMLAAEKALD